MLVTTIRGIYSSTGAVIHVKVCGEPWLCRVSPSLCACHARCKVMVPTAEETHVEGVLVVQGVRFDDNRGFFKELYNERVFPPQVRIDRFRQISLSVSKRDVLRGLHTSPYAKLVSVVSGAVYDVVVDLREESPTFGKWVAHILSLENEKSILIPPGCAHGFLALETTTMLYMQQGTFDATREQDVSVFDEMLDIFWPQTAGGTEYVISLKDSCAPSLKVSRPSLSLAITMKRNLIIGASGQVGGALIERLGLSTCFGTYSTSAAPHATKFCMRDAAEDPTLISDLLTATRPHVVYICAAKTWVDGCEQDEITTDLVNTQAPILLAKMASQLGSKVVFFSTDYVFDGSAGPYDEDAEANPVNIYGKSKLEAEKALLEADGNALVIRTTVVYGPENLGKNFAYQLVSKLVSNEPFTCLADQYSTPTYNRDLAEMVVTLVENNCCGIFNCVGTETISRYEFAYQIACALGLDASLLRPHATSQLENQATTEGRKLAKRGLLLGLCAQKVLRTIDNVKPRSIEESMKHWLENQRGKPLCT